MHSGFIVKTLRHKTARLTVLSPVKKEKLFRYTTLLKYKYLLRGEFVQF